MRICVNNPILWALGTTLKYLTHLSYSNELVPIQMSLLYYNQMLTEFFFMYGFELIYKRISVFDVYF